MCRGDRLDVGRRDCVVQALRAHVAPGSATLSIKRSGSGVSSADETLRLSVDGVSYDIDSTALHAEEFSGTSECPPWNHGHLRSQDEIVSCRRMPRKNRED